MSNTARIAATAANTLTKPLNVEDVFSTYLYDGTGSAQTITNGIDLSGEGGLVWIKERDATSIPVIYDTERGVGKLLRTNDTNAETDLSASSLGITAYNSNGFSLGGTTNNDNDSGINHASWTFRKAPKFFDVVTATSVGSTSRVLSHNLGCDVGFAVVKRLDSTSNWISRHRSLTAGHNINLNTTQASFTFSGIVSFDSTTITINEANFLGTGNYVVYLFAHNDGDGDFGPTGDQDIIKCGSYTGGTAPISVDLGFEPQWVLIKGAVGSTQNWVLFDTMRGITTGGADEFLSPNTSSAETTFSTDYIDVTANGFEIKQSNNGFVSQNSATYIYMAIRRGPMAVPESATDVFDVNQATNPRGFVTTGFPVDLHMQRKTEAGDGFNLADRLRGENKFLYTTETSSEYTFGSTFPAEFDHMNGIDNYSYSSQTADTIFYNWKRAPNFCDVVAYTGNGTAGRTVSHNLGVAPEMIWIKNRDQGAYFWVVGHSALDFTSNEYLRLNDTNAVGTHNVWNSTAPTSSVFSVGSDGYTNAGSDNFIAYLFASLDGVSKVGSYTGNGSSNGDSQNIDCGFSSGARFVLIKRTDISSNWLVFDSTRGIVAGNDPVLVLNSTNAEYTTTDEIDPYSSGFAVTVDVTGFATNVSGASYIFYAIA